jgi:hypothetical protein
MQGDVPCGKEGRVTQAPRLLAGRSDPLDEVGRKRAARLGAGGALPAGR